MHSLILRTACRFLMTLLFMFSLYLLVRGHNAPGGGFVGGLVASAAFALLSLAEDVPTARRVLRVQPRGLIAGGLLIVASSGVASLIMSRPFLTGMWTELHFAGQGFHLGTPILFDVGVYLVVLGVVVEIILALAEE